VVGFKPARQPEVLEFLPGDVQETVQRNVKKYVACSAPTPDNLNRELRRQARARGHDLPTPRRSRLSARKLGGRLLPALEERVRSRRRGAVPVEREVGKLG